MRFHIVGTRKELLRVCGGLYRNLDWIATYSSGIQQNRKNPNLFYLNLKIESRYPYKGISNVNGESVYDELGYLGDQLDEYRLPNSQYQMYHDAFTRLELLMNLNKDITVNEIKAKIIELKDTIESNKKEIEYYETHDLEKWD